MSEQPTQPEQLKPLKVESRRQDRTRVARALIAWKRGDKESLDLVLVQADSEPGGTAGMLLALLDTLTHSMTEKGVKALEAAIALDLDAGDEERRQQS